MLRCEDICLYDITVSEESKWDVLNAVGMNQRMMFQGEFNPQSLNETCIQRIRDCQELMLKLKMIISKGEFFNVHGIVKSKNDTEVLQKISQRCKDSKVDERLLIDTMIEKVNETTIKLGEQVSNYENFVDRINDLKQSMLILENIPKMLPESFYKGHLTDGLEHEKNDYDAPPHGGSQFSYFAGLLNLSEYDRFARMAHRITRGNIFVKNMEVETETENDKDNLDLRVGNEAVDPKTKKSIKKTLVFMLFHGKDNTISKKINSQVKSFDMFCITIPADRSRMQTQAKEIKDQINESFSIYENTLEEIEATIREYYEIRNDTSISIIEEMLIIARREKKLLRAQSYFQACGQNVSKALLWIPARYEEPFLNDIKALVGTAPNFIEPIMRKIPDHKVPKNMTRPTFFKMNDQCTPAQEAVEPLGTPNYKEINPALFTIVTFPYLYAVMFADFGHGMIVFIAGIAVCLFSNKMKAAGGVLHTVATYRYLLLMIGFFSFYNGLVYNDFFARKIPFFESCYDAVWDAPGSVIGDAPLQKHFVKKPDCTYIFGIDWAWALSPTTETMFTNSYKMKFSVIIAVLHMSFGICQKGWNAIADRNWIDLLCEVVPMFLMYAGLFGYMVLLVIVKWFTNYDAVIAAGDGGTKVPQIIGVFSNIYQQPPVGLITNDTKTQWYIQLGLQGNFLIFE